MINVIYTFRNPDKSRDFTYLAPSLQKLFLLVSHVLNAMGYDIVITSMIRPMGTVKTESGVHETGRAMDFVPLKHGDVKEKEADFHKKMLIVAECINRMLPRQDGRPLLMWHQVAGGGGVHFHLQVPSSKDFKDLKGVVPKFEA
jgi:hypothetical protein